MVVVSGSKSVFKVGRARQYAGANFTEFIYRSMESVLSKSSEKEVS